MPYTVRPIGLADIPAVASIMNDSSRGHGFEFRVQPIDFLFLSSLWQFSYRHSYLGLIDSEPVGVVLNCLDAETREAYSFYWGVVPSRRGRPLSMAMVHKYLDQVRQEGYLRTHLDASLSSPIAIYERLGFQPVMDVIQFETGEPEVPAGSGPIVNLLDLDEVRRNTSRLQPPVHWTRRPNFLNQAGPYLHAIGCRGNDGLDAYAVVSSRSGHTLVLDIECEKSPAGGAAIIRYLMDNNYPPPFRCAFVPSGSAAARILREMGFHVTKHSQYMVLDL